MAIYVAAIDHTCSLLSFYTEIQLLEYPIPPRPARPRPRASQKPSSADISETESGIIDPLVSKRPGKILNVNKEKRKK